MVVEEREGSIAIVTNGGDYLVVEIIGEALTYSEAKELMQDTLEEEDEEPEEEEEGEEEEEENG